MTGIHGIYINSFTADEGDPIIIIIRSNTRLVATSFQFDSTALY